MFIHRRRRLASEMNTKICLLELFPRSFSRWRNLALFADHLEDFIHWLGNQGYPIASVRNYLNALPKLVAWLQRRSFSSVAELTQQELRAAREYYRSREPNVGCAVGILSRFLGEQKVIAEGEPPQVSPTEMELDQFADYLCNVRGLVIGTVTAHLSRLRYFLEFLRFDQNPDCLRRLQISQVEAFLQQCARTNNRYCMQHIVATIRAFLQREHALGIMQATLHLQIDSPRVYRLERLPRAIPWDRIEALLYSVDRSKPHGLRDFTLLYLAAAYGLRSSELVHLTLDDIDWRNCTLRVVERKNRCAIQLPLTDEAANIIIHYLRKGSSSK